MPLEAGERYEGVVTHAGFFESKTKKTPYIGFRIRTDHGGTVNRMYITPGTLERFYKTMEDCFGLSKADISANSFLDTIHENASIIGATVKITMKEEAGRTPEDEPRVVVEWMNAATVPQVKASTAIKAVAKRLLAGGPVSQPRTAGQQQQSSAPRSTASNEQQPPPDFDSGWPDEEPGGSKRRAF